MNAITFDEIKETVIKNRPAGWKTKILAITPGKVRMTLHNGGHDSITLTVCPRLDANHNTLIIASNGYYEGSLRNCLEFAKAAANPEF